MKLGKAPPKIEPEGEKTFELHALAVYQLRIRAADRQQAVARFQAFVHWMKDGRDTIILSFPPDANLTVHELAVEPTNIKEENVREVRDGIHDGDAGDQRPRTSVPRRVR